MSLCIEEILSDSNLAAARASFKGKNDSSGMDGVRVSELGEYWNVNGDKIKKTILEGKYSPGLILQQEIVNQKGKRRTISLMNTVDRFIFRAVYQQMAKLWEGDFSAHSYAYQDNKGTQKAVEQAVAYMEAGNIWSAELDIKNFFDNINHDVLMKRIRRKIEDARVLGLIQAYLSCTVMDDHICSQKTKGVLQGGPLSPLLSNIYLDDLDKYMEEKGYHFCRFGDDINVYCAEQEQAFEQLQDVRKHLAEREQLAVNKSKTGVFKGVNRKYLGYKFEEKKGKILARKEQKAYRTVYRDWYTTGIKKIDQNYHLINEGVLTKRDCTLLFEGPEGKKYIPIETTDSLYIYSNVIFSGNFFEFVNDRALNVSLINKYGEKIGGFVSQNSRRNIKTELKQLKLYEDVAARLDLARKLEIAGISNLRANLRYYHRRKGRTALKEAIERLSGLIQKMNEAKDVNQLMTIEAQARQHYYRCFNWILEDEDFVFEKRTRRPPEDPLNAMISFGNTLLYQKIANEINRTSLDIRIGIVHAAGSRPESLNLDLADLFKPIIVDRTIFTLINRNMLDGEDFVEVEKNGIYLSGKGKKQFIQEFERKLYQKIQIDGCDRTYDFVIKSEIQKLKKFIETGEKYKPYKYV